MDNRMNPGASAGFPIGGFFLGMLTGVIIGGVAALLLAPQSGMETRDMVRNRFNQMKDVFRSGAQDMNRMARETKEQVK